MVERAELTRQLHTLGVRAGGVLLVHTSYRAVRPVAGGPVGLIEALRAAVGPDGTIVMPSWGDDDRAAFDPAATRVAADLGITAELFRRLPGIRRSDHPFAFAALGPDAAAVTADAFPRPPHGPASPVGRVHDLDGQVLLLGVGHDANTTLHLAEVLAQVPYHVARRCTVLQGGRAVELDYTETDHCCARFALADEWLRTRGLQCEGPVGNATARLVASRAIVAVALERLNRDPLLFLHPAGAGCPECDEARRTVTI
jgi:aminoglycoside 3-N-acetyltransferase-4